jgi:hypothetical protein
MPFSRFAFFFKQDFAGGYRFLDHCGEFLSRAEEEMGMIPAGEQTPSGGNMEKPEIGLKLEFNTVMLRLTHEMPAEGDETMLIEHAEYFSNLYQALFAPKAVERNGVALQCYRPFADVVLAERESLLGAPEGMEALALSLGMVPAARTREYRFAAGSKNLRVKTHPATFERVQAALKNAGSRATPRQRSTIERQNIGVQRTLEQTLRHALFVDLDLTEELPPENGIRPLVEEMLEKQVQVLQQLYPPT